MDFLTLTLNPLLTMIVLTIVFSNLFRFDIENYPVYLITGQVMFNFFSEATNMAMNSIIDNSQLIKKVYIPKYIFPISKTLSSFVNLIFSLIAVLFLIIILVSLNIFFRDVKHLYGVGLTAWMYLTPIFYPINIIPEKFSWMVAINPLFYMIQHFRASVLYGIMPGIKLNLICFAWASITFIIGLFIFYKAQDKFILYI